MKAELLPPELPDEILLHVSPEKIIPNPYQPRKLFSEKALHELAQSIRTQGVLQPLVVRKHPTLSEHYELVAGERRWRALKKLTVPEVPVILRKVADEDILEVALLENIQRENLTIIEEAQSYRDLLQSHGYTQDELARRIGKDRSTIANLMRLLQLPSALKNDLETGRITPGHARPLLALPGAAFQLEMRQRLLRHSWTVRETERQVRLELEILSTNREAGVRERDWENRNKAQENFEHLSKAETDAQLQNLEEELQRRLGTRVAILFQQGKGHIHIDYHSLDEFERLYDLLIS